MRLMSIAITTLWGALALASCASPEPAVREIAPGVTVIDGGRVRVDAVNLAALEETISQTASLAAVQRVVGRAEVVSPGGGGTMVHMYRLTDTTTNSPKLLLVFVQGQDQIVEHLVTDRTEP